MNVFESASFEHYERVRQRVRTDLIPSTPLAPTSIDIGGQWYHTHEVNAIANEIRSDMESWDGLESWDEEKCWED
jgi:hypothetical protein